MATANELDGRLDELQTQVGDLVGRLERVGSLQELLAETAGNLASTAEGVSKLTVELRSVVGTLESIPRSFKEAVTAFERTEPTKVVDEMAARLDELGKRVAEAESEILRATQGWMEDSKTANERAGTTVQQLLAEQDRRHDEDVRRIVEGQAGTLRTVKLFGAGILLAIVAACTALWLLFTRMGA